MSSARDDNDCHPVDANHPLYLLYTSGTTGNPKAIVRPTGGYAVTLQWTMKYLYDLHPGEVWWSAADLGWVRFLLFTRNKHFLYESTNFFCFCRLGRRSFLRMLRSFVKRIDHSYLRRKTCWYT